MVSNSALVYLYAGGILSACCTSLMHGNLKIDFLCHFNNNNLSTFIHTTNIRWQVLEERTRESKREMDIIDGLEEIKEMNARNSKVDLDTLLQLKAQEERELAVKQLEEDEEKVKLIFGQGVRVCVCVCVCVGIECVISGL